MLSYKSKKSLPFLEVSPDLLNLDRESLDFENVLTVWTTLIKSKNFIKNGRRLENISWRVVNRNLLLKPYEESRISLDAKDFDTLMGISSQKSNKQPFLHTPNPTPPPPKLKKRPSQIDRIHHVGKEITNEVSSSEEEVVDEEEAREAKAKAKAKVDYSRGGDDLEGGSGPSGINDSSTYHHLQSDSRLNHQERFPHTDSHNQNASLHHPEPKYAVGAAAETMAPRKPPMERSSTSTSIVRGFSPSQVSVSYTPKIDAQKQSELKEEDKVSEQKRLQEQHKQHIQQLYRKQPDSRRSNLYNKLSMSKISPKGKNNDMFFIESSPSPAESDMEPKKLSPNRSNASLFGGQNEHQSQILFTSDDSFSDSEPDEWSSVSESEEEENDKEESSLAFEKNDQLLTRNHSAMKRSLLSGLFLNQLHSPPQRARTMSPGEQSSERFDHPSIRRTVTHTAPSMASSSANLPSVKTEGQHLNISSSYDKPATSSSYVVASALKQNLETNKSALNLAHQLANSRRPTHQPSNAPPTASTLLPTALSTHMFIPSAQQRRSKQSSKEQTPEPRTHLKRTPSMVIPGSIQPSEYIAAAERDAKLSRSLKSSLLREQISREDPVEDVSESEMEKSPPNGKKQLKKNEGDSEAWPDDEDDYHAKGW